MECFDNAKYGEIDFETFIEYLKGSVTISGAVIAITLTAFIFLITNKKDESGNQNNNILKTEESSVLGTLCIIYSFLFGLMSFLGFYIMNRHDKNY